MKWRGMLALSIGAAGLAACGGEVAIDCRDLLPREEATFAQVRARVIDAPTLSCSRCHNTRTPVRNLNFEGPGVAYDALTTRRQAVYEQIATGSMPQGGPAWSEEDLRVLRSWYCYGAPYAE